MKPLISIIVPCYNIDNYLYYCVDNILNQTYQNWELILIDDGSTDQTPQICDKYAEKDKRIKVIHKPNGGLVSARNAGYEIAKGDWHMYIDGDDWIDTDTCEKLYHYIQIHGSVDIIFWKCIQELDNQSIKGKWEWGCTDKEHLYINEECHELAKHTLIYKSGIATACCKLIRTDYTRQYGIIHDPRLRQGVEGLEFSLKAFYYARKALFVNEYFTHYRYNPTSISKKVNERNTGYLIECLDVIKEDIDKCTNKADMEKALYHRICYILIAIAMSTYFHPANQDSLLTQIKKYRTVIKDNELFVNALKRGDTTGMDKQRKLTLFFIRTKMYFMLAIIAYLKQYFLKRGKYNY